MSWLSDLLDRGRLHAVDGHVWCPHREQDVDLERCFSCERFLRAGEDAAGPWIRCRPDGGGSTGRTSVLLSGR